jgi:putative hydrolase of the HAD superfamily
MHDEALHPHIRLVGFDGDDTLWRSEDYYRDAQAEFERIVGGYVDLADARAHERLYAIEKANLALFGYGAKGMVLSMLEAAVAITAERISAADLHRIVLLGKSLLQHPVELLPGIREAVAAIGAQHEVVLITKGDLFRRIEIVSEKDASTYARVLGEFNVAPRQFVMIGNSLRSDIAPVLALGGWGVHMPYHVTWVHETEASVEAGAPRLRTVASADALPAAVAGIASLAAAAAAPRAAG